MSAGSESGMAGCAFRLMWVRWLAVSLSLVVTGCGAKLQPVRGKVTLQDGTPASGGLVVFEGRIGDEVVTARGDIQSDGSYELGTHAPGDGTAPGKYQVLVAPPPMVNADAPMRSPFNTKYSDFKTS